MVNFSWILDIPSFWCIICLCSWTRSCLPTKKIGASIVREQNYVLTNWKQQISHDSWTWNPRAQLTSILHINYEEFIFFQNSMLKGKWGWAPSRGFPFSMGNMIRPLHSKLSMADMSSALSSKSNILAFSSMREGVTDLGITTVIRNMKNIDVCKVI